VVLKVTKKVTLAIVDKDLKARTVKQYPVSDSGEQIKVMSGGEAHFMPYFDNDSFIEFPRPRWMGGGFKKVYFAKKGAKKCINFKTETVHGPDPEDMKRAVASSLLDKLGKEKQDFPSWLIYAILLLVIGTALKVFGVIA